MVILSKEEKKMLDEGITFIVDGRYTLRNPDATSLTGTRYVIDMESLVLESHTEKHHGSYPRL